MPQDANHKYTTNKNENNTNSRDILYKMNYGVEDNYYPKNNRFANNNSNQINNNSELTSLNNI